MSRRKYRCRNLFFNVISIGYACTRPRNWYCCGLEKFTKAFLKFIKKSISYDKSGNCCILSDSLSSESPDIFYSAESFVEILPDMYRNKMNNGKTSPEIIWAYLRENKGLFLFPTIEPDETLSKLRINYIFSNFPDNDVFFEGRLSVLLMAPLSNKGKDGVLKEIVFSLEKNLGPYQHRYLLNLHSTRVNGIYLEPSYNQFRRGNLFKQLGFPVGGSE